MFRFKNNSIKCIKILLLLVSSLCLMSTCFSGELNLSPKNWLDKKIDSTEKWLERNKSKWTAVVKNLYSNSLKQAELLKMSPMLTSVKTTTTALNDKYLCTLKDNDVINILYKSNDDFRKNLKNASSNFQKPTKSDMVDSCWVLMDCIIKTGAKIVDSVSYCKMLVNDFYLKKYKEDYNAQSLTQWNEWSDAFRNKKLDDSSFDILNDIYILATILFDSPKEPEETPFYEMPEVATTEDHTEVYEYIISVIKDRFSPYFTVETENNNSWCWTDDEPNWDWDDQTPEAWDDQTPNAWVMVNMDPFDEPLENYQTNTSNTSSSNWYDYLGQNKKCINWDEEEDENSEEEDENNEWDWWDGWNQGGGAWNSWSQWGGGEEWNQGNQCNPESQNTQGGSSNPNPLGNNIEIQFDEETITCFSACDDVPCTASSCDRLACYAKCLCISYKSEWFDPIKTPGLWPIFKLNFCIQPVQDGKTSTSKKVNNLELIVKEINTVIQNLRNSWELMLNKKTKEFLDAGFQNNEMTQISMSIDSFSKVPESEWSEKQEKEDQENLNKSLMENILWFEKDPTIESEWRDKYVVKWWKQSWWSVSSSESVEWIMYSHIESSVLVSSLQSQHLTDMWFQITKFLDSNLNFWITLKDNLNSMNNTANSLLGKK